MDPRPTGESPSAPPPTRGDASGGDAAPAGTGKEGGVFELPIASTLEIRLADGTRIEDFRSGRRWALAGADRRAREEPEPITADELFAEDHHRYYGRPWILGKFTFEHLRRRGLQATDRFLDFGCGAGRVGIWLIPYLERGRYFGVDNHLRSLVAFAYYEAVMHDLRPYRPHLMLDDDFAFAAFGVEFDAMLDFYVSPHLAPARAETAFARARESMREGGRVFMPHAPSLGQDRMRSLGFQLTATEHVATPMFAGSRAARSGPDHWHEFTAS